MSAPLIKCNSKEWFDERGVMLPWNFLEHKPFRFVPDDFTIGRKDSYLKPRVIDLEKQESSLDRWLQKPTRPIVYGVGSEPTDSKARYFASYLIQRYIEAVPNRKVIIHHVYSGFESPLIKNEERCTLLVLHGLRPDSTAGKIEKCIDLLEFYKDIPRIVLVSGTDPITFFSTRLRTKIHSLYHDVAHTVNKEFAI